MPDSADILVVGGGFSGLMAAVFAAREGRRVRVLSRGQGALAVGGGTIDLLGYVPGRAAAVRAPFSAMEALGADHPYRLAGIPMVRQALDGFLQMCLAAGYPYEMEGGAEAPRNRRLLTSIGAMKPSCAVPSSMSMQGAEAAEEVLVVGIEGLKDFFPRLAVPGIARYLKGNVIPVLLRCPEKLAPMLEVGGKSVPSRDVSTLDVANMLEERDGRAWFVDRLRRHPAFARLRGKRGMILLPPVLGTKPLPDVQKALTEALGCPVFELVAPPPGVTGLRLRALLMAELRRLGVDLVMNAFVVRPEYTPGRSGAMHVAAVQVESGGRLRRCEASAFIMATGGIYGDGIEVTPSAVRDRVFGEAAPVSSALKPVDAGWSEPAAYPDFAAGYSHAFARLGTRVGADFRPVTENGLVTLENVFYAGRALGGHDPAAEKSGNGVALVSAFACAVHACRVCPAGSAPQQ